MAEAAESAGKGEAGANGVAAEGLHASEVGLRAFSCPACPAACHASPAYAYHATHTCGSLRRRLQDPRSAGPASALGSNSEPSEHSTPRTCVCRRLRWTWRQAPRMPAAALRRVRTAPWRLPPLPRAVRRGGTSRCSSTCARCSGRRCTAGCSSSWCAGRDRSLGSH